MVLDRWPGLLSWPLVYARSVAPMVIVIRRVILAVLLLGMTGLAAELALISHYEDLTQKIPIILLVGGLTIVGIDLLVRRGWSAVLVQIAMALVLVAGLLGVYFHFQGSKEFQLEMDPGMGGLDLVWHVLRAKSPPTLAPGSMVQLGVLGLGYAYLRRQK
jgi:hypothetical protein